MYKFPTDLIVRGKWVQFVQRHGHDFKDCLCSTNAVFSNFEESRYKRNLSVLSSMEAHGIKMKCSLRKDIVPNRDTDVPPALEKLSEENK